MTQDAMSRLSISKTHTRDTTIVLAKKVHPVRSTNIEYRPKGKYSILLPPISAVRGEELFGRIKFVESICGLDWNAPNCEWRIQASWVALSKQVAKFAKYCARYLGLHEWTIPRATYIDVRANDERLLESRTGFWST
jgi:hypothetical protein